MKMLTHNDHFRQIAYRISPYFDSPNKFGMNNNMLNIADEMASYVESHQWSVQAELNYDVLVNIALNLESVMYEVVYDKKLSAIKKFREITSCGLKTAKDVIEDERIWSHHGDAVPRKDETLNALREKLTTNNNTPDYPWYIDDNNEESN